MPNFLVYCELCNTRTFADGLNDAELKMESHLGLEGHHYVYIGRIAIVREAGVIN